MYKAIHTFIGCRQIQIKRNRVTFYGFIAFINQSETVPENIRIDISKCETDWSILLVFVIEKLPVNQICPKPFIGAWFSHTNHLFLLYFSLLEFIIKVHVFIGMEHELIEINFEFVDFLLYLRLLGASLSTDLMLRN